MKQATLRDLARVVGLCALALSLTAACARPPVLADDPPAVPTTIAVLGRIRPAVEAEGRVVAPVRHQLKSPIDGLVSRVIAPGGTTVSEGQALLDLASTELTLAVGQLERQVELARARVEELRAAVDPEPLRLHIVELTMEQARLEEQERRLLIRAPRAGPLARWDLVRAGQEVAAGEVVGTIFDDTAVHATLLVGEADAAFVELGLTAALFVEAIGRELVGRVVDIDRDGVVHGARRAYPVTVHVFNPGPVLGGMTVRGSMYSTEHRHALVAWGQINRRERADISSLSGGIVEAVYVREGEWVRSGQFLARLVNPELSIALARIRHQLERARRDLAALENQESHAIRAAVAELADRDEALAAARAALVRLTIRSPGPGRLTFAVSPGEPVARSQVLATVVDYRRLTVLARVSETEIGLLTPGFSVTAYLPSQPEEPYPAVITAIEPEGKLIEGGVYFEVFIDPAPPEAMAGMTVRVVLDGLLPPETILLPREAVRGEPGATYVLVADEAGVSTRRAVVTGDTDGVQVEILEGLAEGERVLLQSMAGDRP
jgi:RND family efflux transporter MFP subunit